MKILGGLINVFGVGGLMIASVLTTIASIVLITSVLFNFSPYFQGKDGGGFGLGGYEKGGIPFNARISQTVPDTSIYYRVDNGSGMFYSSYENNVSIKTQQPVSYADTIITKFENISGTPTSYKVLGVSFEEGKVFIKPGNFGQRVWLNIPMILKFALFSYCCWQLGMLLSMISSGKSFHQINFHRLLRVGCAMIAVFILLFIFDIITNNSNHITPRFESSIENYRPPFQASFEIVSRMDISWLVTGCIFVILAAAFKKGNSLQKEQDLTV